MYMVPVVICTRKDYAVSVYSTRERETDMDREQERGRERVREREREWGMQILTNTESQASHHVLFMKGLAHETSLVHAWYL